MILTLTINVFGEDIQDSQDRNIFFNREHYKAEQQEAKEKALRATEKICPNHTQEIQVYMNILKLKIATNMNG